MECSEVFDPEFDLFLTLSPQSVDNLETHTSNPSDCTDTTQPQPERGHSSRSEDKDKPEEMPAEMSKAPSQGEATSPSEAENDRSDDQDKPEEMAAEMPKSPLQGRATSPSEAENDRSDDQDKPEEMAAEVPKSPLQGQATPPSEAGKSNLEGDKSGKTQPSLANSTVGIELHEAQPAQSSTGSDQLEQVEGPQQDPVEMTKSLLQGDTSATFEAEKNNHEGVKPGTTQPSLANSIIGIELHDAQPAQSSIRSDQPELVEGSQQDNGAERESIKPGDSYQSSKLCGCAPNGLPERPPNKNTATEPRSTVSNAKMSSFQDNVADRSQTSITSPGNTLDQHSSSTGATDTTAQMDQGHSLRLCQHPGFVQAGVVKRIKGYRRKSGRLVYRAVVEVEVDAPEPILSSMTNGQLAKRRFDKMDVWEVADSDDERQGQKRSKTDRVGHGLSGLDGPRRKLRKIRGPKPVYHVEKHPAFEQVGRLEEGR